MDLYPGSNIEPETDSEADTKEAAADYVAEYMAANIDNIEDVFTFEIQEDGE